MQEKFTGLVLGGVNFGENDKILTIFTLEKGLITAKIKGVKKAGAKLKFASEPFCFAEFITTGTLSKRVVTGASLIESFYSIREDIHKFFCGGAILEFTRKLLREDIVSKELFSLSIEGLKELSFSNENPKKILALFLINALSVVGYGLTIKDCNCLPNENKTKRFFDYSNGTIYCENCKVYGAREINPLTFETLKNLVFGGDVSSNGVDMVIRLLDYYISNKCEVNIKSLKELISLQINL